MQFHATREAAISKLEIAPSIGKIAMQKFTIDEVSVIHSKGFILRFFIPDFLHVESAPLDSKDGQLLQPPSRVSPSETGEFWQDCSVQSVAQPPLED